MSPWPEEWPRYLLRMRTVVTHVIFIALVIGLGTLSGFANMPGEWYTSLEKPFFNPPSWVFGPAWTVLYILIGIAGARIWLRKPSSSAMQIWFAQLVLNLAWSPAFFGMQSPPLGLFVVLLMLASILVFIWSANRIDRVAALLFLPYAAWVTFATILNFSILILN